MNCTLYLQGKSDANSASVIEFYPNQPEASGIDEKNAVCEDEQYYAVAQIGGIERPIDTIEIFLNNDIPIGYIFQNETGECQVRFEDEKGNETKQPFQLLYDLIVLSVRFNYQDSTSEILHSKYLACISKQPEDTQNAVEMLKALLNFEEERIGRWMFGEKVNEILPQKRKTEPRGQRQTYKTPLAYLRLLEAVTLCYQTNMQYFKTQARHTIKKMNVVRSYSKSRVVSITGFQWLMQNTDQLLPFSNETGVYHEGQYYLPAKILTQEPVSIRDVYENQIVLSFLMVVVKNVQNVKTLLIEDIEERETTLQKMRGPVPDGYQPPTISTIWQLPLQESKSFLKQLDSVVSRLESLYKKYNEFLPCKKFDIKTFPRKTKTFQEVKPYHQVFEQITNWFRFGEFDMEKNRTIFNLRTLDKLFEYYSLYRLLKMLTEAGFDAVQDRSPVLSYEYQVSDNWYENETGVANTYLLEKGGVRLALYYQPVIHSDRFENEISLFRTTIPRRNQSSVYYTPDFLIKLVKGKRPPVYVVLDSKYSNRLSILRRTDDNSQMNYLDRIILKYSTQFAVRETREAPKMIWILQGRVGDEAERSVHYFHNSPLAKLYPPKTNYGIISVNTRTDSLYELWKEIQRLDD